MQSQFIHRVCFEVPVPLHIGSSHIYCCMKLSNLILFYCILTMKMLTLLCCHIVTINSILQSNQELFDFIFGVMLI